MASLKFDVPRPRGGVVHRPRLFEMLDSGRERRLTAVIGSAGSGKTMLLADWLASRPGVAAAWLSCDVWDSDPLRFAHALVEAVRRTEPGAGVGDDALALLRLDGSLSPDAVAALTADLEALEEPLVIVLDDLHVAGAAVVDVLEMLVEYKPAHVQFVVATRIEPRLRLDRMRVGGQLAEVRDTDLSFTAVETDEFLEGFGVRLPGPELALLHQRTEGWVAGLQMAALSIQASPDPLEALGRVGLPTQTIVDYFVREVLERQSDEIADFMLSTSILDVLSIDRCVALCGEGSGPMLDQLDRAHLFVVSVGEQRTTYRYHHLIRDVLRDQLHATDPARERQLCRLAAAHADGAGRVGEAVRHLLAAGDREAAFNRLSRGMLSNYFADPTIGTDLDHDDIDPSLFAEAPHELVTLTGELLMRGAFERGSRGLRLLREIAIDSSERPALAAKVAMVEGFHHFLIGEPNEALARSTFAHDVGGALAELDDWFADQPSLAIRCHAWANDRESFRRLANGPPSVHETIREISMPAARAAAALDDGELELADALATQALHAADRLGFARHYMVSDALRAKAGVAFERADLRTAESFVERAIDIATGARPAYEFLAQLERARIWAARGTPDAAMMSIRGARATLRSERSPLLARADELEARLRLALGAGEAAMSLAERLPEPRRRIVTVMIALAAGDSDHAAEMLELLPAVGVTVREDLELRLLRAATGIAGNVPHVADLIDDAIEQIDDHGFVMSVIETAPIVAEHLVTRATLSPSTPTIAAVVAATIEARYNARGTTNIGVLHHSLTPAELRVLSCLALRLTYPEIASRLHLSRNTVKTHLRHVYMKLGVTSRTAAVERAVALDLV
jgi:LuxR family maltose regulon positive regulatory protein